MDSFYGGRPGRDFGLRNFTSQADLTADATNPHSPVPIDGFAIVVIDGHYSLQQKKYNSSTQTVGYQLVADLTGPQGEPGSSDADGISYDNTTSELTADNVQDVIDEIYLRFNDIMIGIGEIKPLEFDWNRGWIGGSTWTYEFPTESYIDIYEVQANHNYRFFLGGNVGTRCRGLVVSTDIRQVTSGTVSGVQIINKSNDEVVPYLAQDFTASINGYFIVQKDNEGKTGIMSYLIDKDVL